jgi:ATP-dependent DNA helicase RecG
MNIALWADTELSMSLERLCLSGESESLEFKRQIPDQVRDLAKEIAAFSSSGAGRILLGVADDGTIHGLENMSDTGQRDQVFERIVGVCKNIKPPVRPELKWADSQGKHVLCISVAKGREPLYYVEYRPYIRHSTSSRPAEPAEVIEAVRSFVQTPEAKSPDTKHLSALAAVLATVLRWGDTNVEQRSLNPWSDEWAHDAGSCAAKLRDLAVEEWSEKNGYSERFVQLAERLEEIERFRHFIGGDGGFDEICTQVKALAQAMMQELIWPIPFDMAMRNEVKGMIAKQSRRLTDIWKRAANNLFDGLVEAGQTDCGQIGRQIVGFTYYKLPFLSDDSINELRQSALDLIRLEAYTIYMDGGDSQRKIVDRGRLLADSLERVVATFNR